MIAPLPCPPRSSPLAYSPQITFFLSVSLIKNGIVQNKQTKPETLNTGQSKRRKC